MRWNLSVSDSKIYSCGNWVADSPVLKTSFLSDPKEMSTSSPSSFVKENLKYRIFVVYLNHLGWLYSKRVSIGLTVKIKP